jgi:hypothetical protein
MTWNEEIDRIAEGVGFDLFDYQRQYLMACGEMRAPQRTCLYYKTGAGKSFTALASIKLWGFGSAVVICPPSTHKQWVELGERMGIYVVPMSHAKFRQPNTKLSRMQPVIADEFHMFGGQSGRGWKKLDKLALHLDAPMVIMSATPNYNDAERVYCVQHILSPSVVKGGYLQFLYENCTTEQNRFGMVPIVTGFKDYPDAAAFLADLPRVFYLPDDVTIDITDLVYDEQVPDEMLIYNYNRRKHRMMASRMEWNHTVRHQGLVAPDGYLRPEIWNELSTMIGEFAPILVYADHATVAEAASRTLNKYGYDHRLVTGKTSKADKDSALHEFKSGFVDVLVGTASLATGTDGLDRMCHCLLILDDTDDASLRRQLIGRIMPRGDFEYLDKSVFRMVPDTA